MERAASFRLDQARQKKSKTSCQRKAVRVVQDEDQIRQNLGKDGWRCYKLIGSADAPPAAATHRTGFQAAQSSPQEDKTGICDCE